MSMCVNEIVVYTVECSWENGRSPFVLSSLVLSQRTIAFVIVCSLSFICGVRSAGCLLKCARKPSEKMVYPKQNKCLFIILQTKWEKRKISLMPFKSLFLEEASFFIPLSIYLWMYLAYFDAKEAPQKAILESNEKWRVFLTKATFERKNFFHKKTFFSALI